MDLDLEVQVDRTDGGRIGRADEGPAARPPGALPRPRPAERAGNVVVAAELARELGFADVDWSLPEPLGPEEA